MRLLLCAFLTLYELNTIMKSFPEIQRYFTRLKANFKLMNDQIKRAQLPAFRLIINDSTCYFMRSRIRYSTGVETTSDESSLFHLAAEAFYVDFSGFHQTKQYNRKPCQFHVIFDGFVIYETADFADCLA